MPWRLALVAALAAAVVLVLASKPTRRDATGAALPAATPPATTARAATAPAATASTTSAPPTAAASAAPAAPAEVTPAVSLTPPAPAPGLPRLVDLGADRCIPCRAMAPILVELRQEYAGRMQVDFIDVWKDPSAGDPYDIYSIPTQIFFDEHGRELTRHLGFLSKEDILATWKRVGYDFSPPGPTPPAH